MSQKLDNTDCRNRLSCCPRRDYTPLHPRRKNPLAETSNTTFLRAANNPTKRTTPPPQYIPTTLYSANTPLPGRAVTHLPDANANFHPAIIFNPIRVVTNSFSLARSHLLSAFPIQHLRGSGTAVSTTKFVTNPLYLRVLIQPPHHLLVTTSCSDRQVPRWKNRKNEEHRREATFHARSLRK